MKNKTYLVLKAVSWSLVAIMVLMVFFMAGIRLFGVQVYTVLSGSMEPNYHTGALIYVKKVDPAQLKEKDVITFRLSGSTTATHRIIELVPDEEDPSVVRFRTKGDANEREDGSLVEGNDVIGKVFFTIPYLGYLATFIQSPPGLYIAIAVGGLLVLLVSVIDMLADDKKNKKKI